MPRKATEKTIKKSTKSVETEEKTGLSTPGGKYFYANGKRKTAVANVRLYKGQGSISINEKPLKDFCTVKSLIGVVKSPLKLTGTLEKYDIIVKVRGGGINAQAEATRHGISKALMIADPLTKPILKKMGLLTRDSRIKERKKPGLKRARKGPQFSKR